MITDLILTMLFGIVNILLAPLTIINIGVDFVGSMPVVFEFLQVVAYILPWGNFLPLFLILFSIFTFRIGVAIIKTIWQLLPLL